MLEFSLAENFTTELDFSEPVWIEALPARNYHTPMYGEVPVTVDKLQRMVKGFKEGIRGQDIAVNYDHGMDRAKGNKAAGWYRGFDIGTSSVDGSPTLKALIQFTDEAAQEIKSGAWKYFSMEWDDLWVDNTGTPHEDVIIGGALTNRPVAKHMAALPVNFSEAHWKELDEDTQKYFAVWSTKFVNDLPDSSFLYIEPGGSKGSDGKTEPRDKRHFPYKGADGKIDLPHLRNAIARIPQAGSWLSSGMKSTLQAKARALLTSASKNMAEPSGPDTDDPAIKAAISAVESAIAKADSEDQPQLKKALALLQGLESDETKLSEAIENAFDAIIAESKEWEHSEPGTGPTPQIGSPEQPDPGTGQPVPRKQGDPSKEDPAIGGGWRREPMPPPDVENEGDIVTDEELKELRKALGVAEDADVPTLIGAASKTFSEAAETKRLREEVAEASEEKRFAEEYPHVHKRMMEQEATLRETQATKFSESVGRVNSQEGEKLIPSDKGLSALALDKIKEVHKKFAEGAGSVVDFEEAIKTVVNGGIVDFSEKGSSREGELPTVPDTSTPSGVAAARKLFAEKIAEAQKENSELSWEQAIQAAAIKHPELASAYTNAPVPA